MPHAAPLLLAGSAIASAPARLPSAHEYKHKAFVDRNAARAVAGQSARDRGAMAGGGRDRRGAAQSQRHGTRHGERHGQPSARVVLCKEIAPKRATSCSIPIINRTRGAICRPIPAPPWFFTGTTITGRCVPKGRSSAVRRRERRLFRTRPWQSRLGAWASRQSEPVESRGRLGASVAAAARRFGIPYGGPGTPEPESVRVEVPRPPHWGGFRLNVDAVELWVEGEFRIHDRARWTRVPDCAGLGCRADVDRYALAAVTANHPMICSAAAMRPAPIAGKPSS